MRFWFVSIFISLFPTFVVKTDHCLLSSHVFTGLFIYFLFFALAFHRPPNPFLRLLAKTAVVFLHLGEAAR